MVAVLWNRSIPKRHGPDSIGNCCFRIPHRIVCGPAFECVQVGKLGQKSVQVVIGERFPNSYTANESVANGMPLLANETGTEAEGSLGQVLTDKLKNLVREDEGPRADWFGLWGCLGLVALGSWLGFGADSRRNLDIVEEDVVVSFAQLKVVQLKDCSFDHCGSGGWHVDHGDSEVFQ